MTSYPLVSDYIRSSRLRWLGHILRSGPERTTHHVFNENMVGRRPRGRPRTRWKDVVKADLRLLDTDPDIMEELAEDRREWRRIVVAAKGLNRPNAPGEWVWVSIQSCTVQISNADWNKQRASSLKPGPLLQCFKMSMRCEKQSWIPPLIRINSKFSSNLSWSMLHSTKFHGNQPGSYCIILPTIKQINKQTNAIKKYLLVGGNKRRKVK